MAARKTNGKVEMPKREFVKEHKDLVKVLRAHKSLRREYKEQKGELRRVVAG